MAFPSERARAMYLALALKSRVNGQGQRVQENVGHEHLSRAFGVSPTTVERDLREMDRRKLLTRNRQFARGPKGGIVNAWTHYTLHVDPADARTAILAPELETAAAMVALTTESGRATTETMPSRSQENEQEKPCRHADSMTALMLRSLDPVQKDRALLPAQPGR